jgi:acyl-homoserine lactone acylase PvdQ
MLTKRTLACAVAVSTLGAALAATPAKGAEERFAAPDGAVTALNILPPGQGRYLNTLELAEAQTTGSQPAHNTDQAQMYADLIKLAPNVTEADLPSLFKDASLGLSEEAVAREYEPREGVTVARDEAFGVPHVSGETREDVMFGAGYVSAEDRLFMMDTLRHVGRGRLSEFLGASDSNLQSDRAAYAASGYTEEELQSMLDRLPAVDPRRGRQIIEDVNAYAEGVNAYIDEALADPEKLPGEYVALQQMPSEWLPTDTVAVASLIGSQLGVGGGGELENAEFIDALRREGFSYNKARAILRDFRFANDKEAPVTTEEPFPWNTKRKLDPNAIAMPDDPRVDQDEPEEAAFPQKIDGPFGPIPLRMPDEASNALLVGRSLSETGRPLAVFGPQVGYWSPQILMEMQLQGPGISSRGVGFPGISMYTLLGRGDGYAWSATSADGDQVDIVAEELCDPDGGDPTLESTHYLDGDECVEIYSRTDSWFAKPSAGGIPDEPDADRLLVEMTTERTDDGIVQARGTVDKKPVVFVQKRSTFMKEVDSASTYVDIMNPEKINNARDFQRAFARFGFTFNWFYVDARDIAFQLGGYHPIRSKATDLDLPYWGNNDKWDWRGMLPRHKTPNAISPERGYLTSWNNKQAPGFRSADSNFNYGPVHREMPLSDGIEAATAEDGKMDLVDLVNVMGDAATVDLRGYAVLPYMLEAIGTPKDPRLKEAVRVLQTWHESGSHRRDVDGDGAYDHSAAVALMDAWWERALSATFTPVLGSAYDDLPAGHDNAPGPRGSAYIGGLYGHMQKDLRTILGYKVRSPFSRSYCGKGGLARCRDALTTSLDAAVKELEETHGASPSTWDANEEGDMIRFSPVGVQGQDPIPWQNRPTFQQVMEFGSEVTG